MNPINNYFPVYNSEELKKIRKSSQISAFVLKELIKNIKPGVTPIELEQRARRLIKVRGCEPAFLGYNGYEFATCISVNNAVVHGLPDSRKIKESDLIGIDLGVKYDGYYSDCAVTVPVGKISNEAQKLLRITKKALNEAVKIIKPKIHLGDVEYTIEKILSVEGLGIVKDLTGHGVGKSLHEGPSIRNYGKSGSGPLLQEGNVLAIEPMATLGDGNIKVDGSGWTVLTRDDTTSAQFEYTVEVTRTGCRILTQW